MWTTLIPTHALAPQLDDPDRAIVDCTFDLMDPDAGEAAYRAAHIPGAVYAHLDRDLSGRPTGTNGRHPLPPLEAFLARLGQWGIDSGTQVVVYDQDAGMFAVRLWWLLRYLGHNAVALLDGGLATWCREARPTRSGQESRPPKRFTGAPRESMRVGIDELQRRLLDPHLALVDARAPERYRGELEPLDPVAGHIPGARNHFYHKNLSPEGTFLDPALLRAEYKLLLGDRSPQDVICYCGSGVAACHNLLAMEHAGLTGARLYAGSWSEWCADRARPVEPAKD